MESFPGLISYLIKGPIELVFQRLVRYGISSSWGLEEVE